MFPDVPPDHWAAEEIDKAVERDFFDGYPDGTFRPDEPVTRAQLAKVANKVYEATLPEPEPEPEPSPEVDEPYPSNAVLAQPGDNIRQLALQGPVELADGEYGDQTLGSIPGAYVFSKTGNAVFDGGHQVGPFLAESSGVTLRNFHVRRFLPGGDNRPRYDGIFAGAGMIVAGDHAQFLDMQVGLSLMNGYRLHGDNILVDGGRTYDCHRFAWNGSGSDNTVRNQAWERCGYATNEVGTPHEPFHELHNDTPEWGNRGVCKIAHGGFWLIEDWVAIDIWNGPWWDIANEPGVCRRGHVTRAQQNGVFVEVSYGSEATGRRWQIEDITGAEMHAHPKPTIPDHFPTPAIVMFSLTPDGDIRRVSGDGSELVTVGLQAWNHSQLSHQDHTRMGIDNITIEDTHFEGRKYGFGWEGDARDHKAGARHGRPTFVNCTAGPGQYRWQGQDLDRQAFEALL